VVDKIKQQIEITDDGQSTQAFDRIANTGTRAFGKLSNAAKQADQALKQLGFGELSRNSSAASAATEKLATAAYGLASKANAGATAIANLRQQMQTAAVSATTLSSRLTSIGFGALASGASSARAALSSVSTSVNATNQSFSLLTPQLKSAGAAIAAVFATKAIADRADTYTNLQSRIRLVTKDEKELAATEQKLADISRRSQGSYEGTITLYTRLAQSTSKQVASSKDLLQFTENIGKAFRISGATTHEQTAAMVQLSQAMAKGKLDGDEFRTIMETFPVFGNLVAKGLGTTRESLAELSAAGQLTTRDLLRAVKSQTGEINKLFAKVTPTISNSMGQLSDSFTRFLGTLDKAAAGTSGFSGAINSVIRYIDDLNKHLQTTQGKKQLQDIINVFKALGNVAASLGTIIAASFRGWQMAVEFLTMQLNKLFNTTLSPLQVFLGIITALVLAFAPLPLAVAAVLVVIGMLISKMKEMGGIGPALTALWNTITSYITQKASEIWNYIVKAWDATIFGQIVNAIIQFFRDGFTAIVNAASKAWETLTGGAIAAWNAVTQAIEKAVAATKQFLGLSAGGAATGAGAPAFARGGPLRGPGTARSDSILARLSRGEYVIRAAAVRRYGADLFAALNGMHFSPSAIVGSLAPAVSAARIPLPAYADGGAVSGRPVTLNLDGASIGGLTATPTAVLQLERYAVKRSLTRGGKKPTWYR